MSGSRRVRMLGCVLALVLAVVACDRKDASPVPDTLIDSATAPVAESSPESDWVAALGQLLIVPSDSENSGVVLFPATPTSRLISGAPITLLNAAGDSVRARAALVSTDSQVCGEAPIVRFDTSVPSEWTVGLVARRVAPLRMDSTEILRGSDSLRVISELARIGSSLPMRQDSRFKGLPFVVLTGRQFEVGGRRVLAAHLIRRLPQEAAPIEEHTFLIAERESDSAGASPWSPAYHQRSEGSEETADHFEVLAAVGGETTLLLIARYQDAQTVYEILERDAAGAWRSRWSRVLSC